MKHFSVSVLSVSMVYPMYLCYLSQNVNQWWIPCLSITDATVPKKSHCYQSCFGHCGTVLLGTRPRRHPFRSSFFMLSKRSESRKLKSQKQFLFRNLKSKKAGKQNWVKAHRIPKIFWPNFSSASESFHQKWRQIFGQIIFIDWTDHTKK